MKNKNYFTFIITTILCLLPIAIGLYFYDALPEQIPTHFNFSGEIDGYTQKDLAIFGLPLFIVAINALTHFAVNNDPKNNNQNIFVFNFGKWVCPILSVILVPASFYIALDNQLNINSITLNFVALIFIIIGNYLPKCKQNYTIGIKLPWTLNSERNWNLTHRLATCIWVISGLLILCLNFIKNSTIGTTVLISAILLSVVIPTIYSYILYSKGI